MNHPSFAEKYIALSRATGRVADLRGNIVEAKDIPHLLAKIGDFKMEWGPYMVARDHIQLERLDAATKFTEMERMLDAVQNKHRSAFLYWHMELTKQVWGPWMFHLPIGKTCRVFNLIIRSDLNGSLCTLQSFDASSSRWCATIDKQVIRIRRSNLRKVVDSPAGSDE